MDYLIFRTDYAVRFPSSVPRLRLKPREYPWWLAPLVFAMFLASAFVSGAHTMVEIYLTITPTSFITEEVRQWIARVAVLAFELTLFVAVYALVKTRQAWIAWCALIVAFIVAFVCNIKNVADNMNPQDSGTWVVVFAVGGGAPLIALLSGKLFVDIHRSERARHNEADEQFRLDEAEYDRIVNVAYEAQLAEIRAHEDKESAEQRKHEERLARLQKKTENESSRNFMKSREGKKRRVNIHEVAKKVHENGDVNLPVDDMMEKYDISQGSTSKVREIAKTMNGHHKE